MKRIVIVLMCGLLLGCGNKESGSSFLEPSTRWRGPSGDGCIYGAYDGVKGKSSKFWRCVNWDSGEEMYQSQDLAPGAVIYADGMLYCYTTKGDLALVKPDTASFNVISQTKVTYGTAQHLAHPVIHKGVLYIRHGNALIAYKIK